MVKVNPKYEHLRQFIENIPHVFEREGKEIYRQRNVIKVFNTHMGTILNVKRYHKPRFLNRFVYSWNIRRPKGRRAYENSATLTGCGIRTPEAVALLEERNWLGIMGYSYLITIQSDYPHTLYEVADMPRQEYLQLAAAVAKLAVRFHESRILHKDFTPGNILWKKDESGYHLSIVDINRMRFGDVGFRERLDNIKRFWGPKLFTEAIAREYARLMVWEEGPVVRYTMERRKMFWEKYLKRHEVPFTVEL